MPKSFLNNLLTIFATVGLATTSFSQGATTVSTSLFSKKDSLSACGLKIGQNYQGGIIFHIDTTGCHGLICAPMDQSRMVNWNKGEAIETNAIGAEIGTGTTNTKLIVASPGDAKCAATLCEDLVLDGYSDWYLPSIDELDLLYKNLYLKQLGNLMWGYYWSSTEFSDFIAWYECFYDGAKDNADKANILFVRAVRAF
jgi:hypothetical protein